MSWQVRSTSKSRGRGDGQEPSQLVAPVAQQPGDEQPEQEPPTQSQAIATDQEREDEGASAVQGLGLEAVQQELTQPKTGGERGDGPDVKGKNLPNLEPIKMPEAGEGQPQV